MRMYKQLTWLKRKKYKRNLFTHGAPKSKCSLSTNINEVCAFRFELEFVSVGFLWSEENLGRTRRKTIGQE